MPSETSVNPAAASLPPDQQALAAKASAGDRVALERLLLIHYQPLLGWITKHVPEQLKGLLAPEDILQDVCLLAFRHARTFVPTAQPDAFSSWLFTLRNHLLDVVKAHRTLKRDRGRQVAGGGSAVQVLVDMMAGPERTPSRVVARQEAVGAMQVALAGLKDEHRQVLELRYLQGLSVAETAQKMQRTDHAVHMLCNRAMAQLRRSMGDASKFLSSSG